MGLHHARALDQISDRLMPCNATVLWSRYDATPILSTQPTGILVDRNVIDPILRESAVEAGALYHERHAKLPSPSVIQDASGRSVFEVHSSGPVIRSRFLVDAMGASSSLRGARVSLMPRTFAVIAQVQGLRLQPGDSRVEALADGWLWAARSDQSAATVALFMAAQTICRWGRSNHSANVAQMLGTSTLLIPKALRIVSQPKVRDATAVECAPNAAEHLWRAGDAALRLDPLSGQGVQHALASAVQVAIVLNTLIARPESDTVAREFYCNSHRAAVREHLTARAALYRRQDRFNTSFWRERAQGPFPVQPAKGQGSIEASLRSKLFFSRQVCWKKTPVIKEDFVERQEALCHPGLTRPIAFFAGQPVRNILQSFSDGCTGDAFLQACRAHGGMDPALTVRALEFFMARRVIEPLGEQSPLRQKGTGLEP
jgi:2-polyprenyl-6-methoxyphenol hydroxylase-like FAD-dependent oxidoreductase